MEHTQKDIKLILTCNSKGIVQQVVLDTDSMIDAAELPSGLHAIVSPDSLDALADFWLQVTNKGMVENVMLKLQISDIPTTYSFSGYLLDDKILLCGSNKISSMEKALTEILKINNEQQNHIRQAEKQLITQQQTIDKLHKGEGLLVDFSKLNNELVNKQRELTLTSNKILQLNKKLEKANENMKMFTYSISHDLKEPVRMISSFIGLLEKKYGSTLDDKANQYLHFALDGATRLNAMITDLLEFYRSSEISNNELTDLNEVVQDVTKILKSTIDEKNASITITQLPVLHGSFSGWRQVFQNLISNALKFTPDDRTPVIDITATQQNNVYQISVSDNGPGIAEEDQHTIFHLFKRAHSNKNLEGSGMGLAIVKRIVELYDAEIHVESELGKGSSFVIGVKKG